MSTALTHIREYRPEDEPNLRDLVVALQEFERVIDPDLPSGKAVADSYCLNLHRRCADADGKIFISQLESVIVGFVAVLANQQFTEPDDPHGTYALVTDLFVQEKYRGRGIGSELLSRAESYAISRGSSELRVELLSRNDAARRLYLDTGFTPHIEIFRKKIGRTQS